MEKEYTEQDVIDAFNNGAKVGIHLENYWDSDYCKSTFGYSNPNEYLAYINQEPDWNNMARDYNEEAQEY